MIQIELNKSNNNPFFGMSSCMDIQNGLINENNLSKAWDEAKDDKIKREMFFSLLFSVGDITARQHNIFRGKKVDSGGSAERKKFEVILAWLWKNNREQYRRFLYAHLFNEFTCFDILFKNRIQTKGTKVLNVYTHLLDKEYVKTLLDYTYSIIKGSNPFDKMLVSKFLTIPRLSKRQGHKKMLPETKKVMELKAQFLTELSKMLGWETKYFKGYRDWRKEYNGNLESVLFSTGKINEFTKDEFLKWLDQLPAQARFRVKNRILYSKNEDESPKWSKFQPWIKEWETYKEEKQAEQRVLEEKVRQGQASVEDKQKLEKVKKEAKITVGATNFTELYNQICTESVDKLRLESFVQNKVNLPYNSLVIIDDSGSMSGKPFNFAKFLASVCLVKNPDDDARNLLGFFNTRSHWHSFIDRQGRSKNSLLRTTIAQTNTKPLVNGTLSFFENYQRISSFCDAVAEWRGTSLNSIPQGLEFIIKENPDMLDCLKNYPIWTVISD